MFLSFDIFFLVIIIRGFQKLLIKKSIFLLILSVNMANLFHHLEWGGGGWWWKLPCNSNFEKVPKTSQGSIRNIRKVRFETISNVRFVV